MGSPMSLMRFAIKLYHWAADRLKEGKPDVAGFDLDRGCVARHNQRFFRVFRVFRGKKQSPFSQRSASFKVRV